MKRIFFIMFYFLCNISYSQDTLVINQSTWIGELQNNFRNGFWQEYSFIECLNNNQLVSEGYFVNGKKNGAWKFYGASHQCDMELQSHGNFINDKKEGKWVYEGGYSYYTGNYNHDLKQGVWLRYDREVSDSIVYCKENYINGIPDGVWKLYNPEDGEIVASGKMTKGQMDGLWKTSNCIGQLKINPDTIIYNPILQNLVYRIEQDCEEMYETNNKVGEWKYFYEGTLLSSTGIYINGKKEGVWKKFFPNGVVERVGEYHTGKKEGIWKDYYENGNVKTVVTYKNGKLNGNYSLYSKDGFLVITGYFTDSNRSGEWKSYSKDSIIINVGNYNELPDEYKLSRLHNSCDSDVEICENIFRIASGGYHYQPDGYYLPSGNKQGYWIEYNSNGGFIEKGVYNNNGKRIGSWKIYSNNDLKAIYTYKDGVLDGDFVEFNWYYKYVWRCGTYKNGEILILEEFKEAQGQTKEEYLNNIN